jgi:hypothetical protein
MSPEERTRLLHRLRALMARTVANGCTEEEELAAARLVGRMAAQMDSAAEAPPSQPAERVRAERESADYQAALERTTLEGLLKAAIQELSLNHINTVSPPGRKLRGQMVSWVAVPEMLQAHLTMMLGTGASRLAQDLVAQTVEELIQDGQLPARLAIPLGE